MSAVLFNYPIWFVILCFITALAITGILYWRNRIEELSAIQKSILAAVRFIVVLIICILLLSPVLEMSSRSVEDPIIVYVDDNSESVKVSTDSALLYNYTNRRQNLISDLKSEYLVHEYLFGEDFRRNDNRDYNDKITDMSSVFTGLIDYYSNRNIGAVIIASDGTYNRGSNPVYLAEETQFPVYTVALGDTIVRRDLIINNVSHNSITYLGNVFPVEIVVEAVKSEGLTGKLTISKEGEKVYSKMIEFTSDHHFETVMAELEASEAGMEKYEIRIEPVDNESNIENNYREFYIDVIDSRQKVLILSDSPHPDIGAIKLSLEDNENYEVEHFNITKFNEQIDAYNLIILHQLPSRRLGQQSKLTDIQNSNIPVLVIIGPNSNLGAVSNMNAGISIIQRSRQFNSALSALNKSFSLFSIGDNFESFFTLMPPLYSPFANYQSSPALNILAYQKIGDVVTDDPLIAFSNIADRKYGFICGEGIWRWKLNNYMREENHDFFNELVSKTVQFLSLKEDKSLFRVNTKNIVYENEPLIFEAELYNKSYELINDPEVSMLITNEEGVSFNYEFSATSNAYVLDAGTFSPGDYSYKAQTRLDDEKYEISGKISVVELNIEAVNTVADHGLLYRIASETNADLFYPDELDALAEAIKSRDDIKGIIYNHKEYTDIINWKWLFFLILVLLSFEWFVRKRSGSY
ncbi:MAG: hypothetical protein R6U11_11140 [Bacteroidales bacterium]